MLGHRREVELTASEEEQGCVPSLPSPGCWVTGLEVLMCASSSEQMGQEGIRRTPHLGHLQFNHGYLHVPFCI